MRSAPVQRARDDGTVESLADTSRRHDADDQGRCKTCGDIYPCRVRWYADLAIELLERRHGGLVQGCAPGAGRPVGAALADTSGEGKEEH